MPIKSGTKPVLKSKDDFWVGDGADLECTIHASDGLGTTPDESFGTTTTSVSNRSAAQKWWHEDKKKRAAQEEVAKLQAQDSCSSEVMAKKQEIGNEVSVEREGNSMANFVSVQWDNIIDAYTVPIVSKIQMIWQIFWLRVTRGRPTRTITWDVDASNVLPRILINQLKQQKLPSLSEVQSLMSSHAKNYINLLQQRVCKFFFFLVWQWMSSIMSMSLIGL